MSLKEWSGIPASGPEPDAEIEHTAAWYLFAISRLSVRSEGPVTTGELNEYLGVTGASVTEMSSRLDDDGYVTYEKYDGVQLTSQGKDITERLCRRFCVVSNFFDAALDVRLDERTAFEIGFRLPEEAILCLRERITASCHSVCPDSEPDAGRCPA